MVQQTAKEFYDELLVATSSVCLYGAIISAVAMLILAVITVKLYGKAVNNGKRLPMFGRILKGLTVWCGHISLFMSIWPCIYIALQTLIFKSFLSSLTEVIFYWWR